MRKAFGLAGTGVIMALLATRLLVDVLSALLVGADAHDARTFAAAGLLMVLVALVAAVGPAIRSVGINLVSELRS
jgi:hypothetical protein